jgi:hypothetical protein
MNDQGQNCLPEAKMFVKDIKGKEAEKDGQQNT